MKFKEIKDMPLAQIWEKIQKPFNFAWKAGIIVIAVGITCGLLSELMGWLWCYIEQETQVCRFVSNDRRLTHLISVT